MKKTNIKEITNNLLLEAFLTEEKDTKLIKRITKRLMEKHKKYAK